MRIALVVFALLGVAVLTPRQARAQWNPAGVRLSAALPEASSYGFAICADGSGGCFIAWDDSDPSSHVFVQHLDRNGRVVTGWPPTGLVVGQFPVDYYDSNPNPALLADGVGGCFVSWADQRGGDPSVQTNIFTSHIAYSGLIYPGWSLNGTPTAPGVIQVLPIQMLDGAGGVYVFVRDYRLNIAPSNPSAIYVQHFDAFGALASGWPTTGKPVVTCMGELYSELYYVVPDSTGGFIVGWPDDQFGQTRRSFAQRINASGEVAAGWDSCGVLLSAGQTDDLSLYGLVPTAGGAIAVLREPGNENHTYDDQYSTLGFDLSGHRLPPWAGGRIRFLSNSAHAFQFFGRAVSDGAGGLFAAWNDERNVTTGSDIYVQHVSSTGAPAAGWPLNGAQADNYRGPDSYAVLVPDNTGGVYVGFTEVPGVRVSHVVSPGVIAPGWNPAGEPVTPIQSYSGPVLCPDGSGGALSAFASYPDFSDTSYAILAQHIGVDAPVPTELSLVSSDVTPTRIQLDWYTPQSGATQLELFRRTPTTDWQSLGTLMPDGSGLAVYEDQNIVAGERYGYRLGYSSGGVAHFTAETWLQVPLAARFALGGARPNPAPHDHLAIAFSLDQDAPAQLELYDVTGRRVALREVGSLGAGDHVVRLEPGAALGKGMYWLRLSQGARHSTTRVAVVE